MYEESMHFVCRIMKSYMLTLSISRLGTHTYGLGAFGAVNVWTDGSNPVINPRSVGRSLQLDPFKTGPLHEQWK